MLHLLREGHVPALDQPRLPARRHERRRRGFLDDRGAFDGVAADKALRSTMRVVRAVAVEKHVARAFDPCRPRRRAGRSRAFERPSAARRIFAISTRLSGLLWPYWRS
jgi:hypothetical protein